MRSPIRRLLTSVMLCALYVLPAHAQQPARIVTDLLTDLGQVEEKLMSLARAIPEDKWGWRPSEGARSVGEVYLHIAADNWFLPTGVGVEAPPATGIKAGEYPTVQAYEGRQMGMAEILTEVERSFAHLKQAMNGTTEAQVGATVSVFGRTFTRQQFWILTTTHLHEHLGQMIAYARSHSIVPPWSGGS